MAPGRSKRVGKGRSKKDKKKHRSWDQDLLDRNWSLTERNTFLELELRNTTFVKEQFKASLDALQREMDVCQKELDDSEKSRQEMAKYLYTSEQRHEETVLKFYTDFAKLKKSADEEKRSLQEQAAQVHQELLIKLEFQDLDIGIMQQELHKFKHYDRERLVMHQQLDELRETVLDVTKDHQDVIDRLERRFMTEKKRLEDSTEQKLEAIAREAHAQAICNLSKKSLRIFNENIQLMAAVRVIMDQNMSMKAQMEDAKLEVLRYKYEQESRQSLLKQLIDKYHQLVTVTKILETENADYKAQLDAQSASIARERELLQLRLSEADRSTRTRLEGLAAIVRRKNAELKRVAEIARTIMEQRTDVETFLSNAIQFVKTKVRSGCCDLVERAPSIYSRYVIRDRYTEIDWDAMSWRKRENILRYLFLQINSVKLGEAPKKRVTAPPTRPALYKRWYINSAKPPDTGEASTQTDLAGSEVARVAHLHDDEDDDDVSIEDAQRPSLTHTDSSNSAFIPEDGDVESQNSQESDNYLFMVALLEECLDA